MTEEEWIDPGDKLLSRSVFGTDDLNHIRWMISNWAVGHGFGQAVATEIDLSVGAAVTLVLADQSEVFLKVWPGSTDVRALRAQMEVQRRMSEGGFPAPGILTEPSALGPAWAVAMEYDRKGVPTDVRIPGVRKAMAAGLARFVSEAGIFRKLNDLPRRSLPTNGAIWPAPHSALFDFEATRQGAEWIDNIASRSLAVMRSAHSRIAVGHCDWSAKNMRMHGGEIAVVYDWDAVFLDHETIVLGAAAANFPITWELDVPETPSVDQVAAFVHEYEQARGKAFTRSEITEIESGATYARAYKARCEHAIDPDRTQWSGSSRESLKANGAFRF